MYLQPVQCPYRKYLFCKFLMLWMKFKIVLTNRNLLNWRHQPWTLTSLMTTKRTETIHGPTYTSYCGYNKRYGNKMGAELALRKIQCWRVLEQWREVWLKGTFRLECWQILVYGLVHFGHHLFASWTCCPCAVITLQSYIQLVMVLTHSLHAPCSSSPHVYI